MTTALDKGNALEIAVRAIENQILRSSPALKENKFIIASKQLVNIQGVRHEIDILVEIDLGKGYKAIFIFECKNWEDKVGKNEIIVFSEKVDALQAQKGFFVAKSFTADAQAQANKDQRIVLLHATEYVSTPVPFDFHILHHSMGSVSVRFSQSGLRKENGADEGVCIDVKDAKAYLQGNHLDLQSYLFAWADDLANENLKGFRFHQAAAGEYEFAASGERTYETGELKIKDIEIRRAELSIKFVARVFRPAVISDFEVGSRGRVLSLAPVSVGGGNLQVHFVASV